MWRGSENREAHKVLDLDAASSKTLSLQQSSGNYLYGVHSVLILSVVLFLCGLQRSPQGLEYNWGLRAYLKIAVCRKLDHLLERLSHEQLEMQARFEQQCNEAIAASQASAELARQEFSKERKKLEQELKVYFHDRPFG